MKNFMDRLLDGNRMRRSVLVTFDVICYAAVNIFFYAVASWAGNSIEIDDRAYLLNTLVQLVMMMAFRWIFDVYRNVWRYSSTKAYFDLVLADACGGVAAVIVTRLIHVYVPGAYNGLWQAATVGALTALMTLMSRFVYSLLYKKNSKSADTSGLIPAVIVGAGRLGSYLAGDLRNNPNSAFDPIFFVDIDGTKIHNRVSGLKVYDEESAVRLIKELGIRDVIVAITRKDSEQLAEIYHRYHSLGCRVRVYDSLVSDSKEHRGVLREFSIEDLLFRKAVKVADAQTVEFYAGKTVLVTGGGGSIGSELCRQIAACGPKKLVIFDIYENNAYDIQQELIRRYGGSLDLAVEIGSVRDPERLDGLFDRYRPDVVFHAAAHKHVPLMENCGPEAIKNNCLGTYNTANAAEKYGVKKFILISTDKAVNPTNIMGASKRICEMVIQCRTDSATSFAAVRFGNVLGSNGSVIPLFKRQIAEGGPVTITDKRIIRYFMTIPEASQLVILAGAMAKKGELFVLDMGKPVRIYDLAVNMIQLSGLEPHKDIRIEEIGLRPGEKLYEELLMKTEQLVKTDNDMIFIERDTPCTREEVEGKLRLLTGAIRDGVPMQAVMKQVVPTYSPAEEVNRTAENSDEMKAVE